MSNGFVVLMGMGTVFFGLICIVLLCYLMSLIVRKTAKEKPAPAQAAPAKAAPAPLANKGEIIAAVAAVDDLRRRNACGQERQHHAQHQNDTED